MSNGGRGYSAYLYENAKRRWIIDMIKQKHRYKRLDQIEIICRLKLSWPAWRAIINGGEMKMSTFIKICDHFKLDIQLAIVEEVYFQKHKEDL